MASFNKVILMGNLTRDPESKFTTTGTQVTEFGLAINHKFKQLNESKEEVCFIDIVVFGKQGESCQNNLTKGSSVLIEGRLNQNRWETPEGQKRMKHQVVASSVTFVGAKNARE